MANLIRYSDGDIVVSTDKLTTSTWSDNTNNLQVAFTSSLTNYSSNTASGQFFIEVFNKEATDLTSQVQYAVAYGNRVGSGSPDFTNDIGSFGFGASRVIYNQYRQLVFGDETQNFTFDKHTPNDIYVININRGRYKNNLKPGTLNLTLSGSGLGFLHLTDDSITSTGSAVLTNAGRQFNIVSGSNGVRGTSATVDVTNSGSYGFFYPDSGFIILNPAALDHTVTSTAPTTTANTAANNHEKLVNAIGAGGNFIVDSEEKVSSTYYFARARNFEFNYTTNPSFTDDNGNVLINSMINNPTVYISTVGMYNDSGDLLAVAKLSQPVTKDFTKEALIRVKLDY